ncbi:unnamed protein product [Miscanthus lutarioriparius]|uniref:Uncharacterized protein n=1 Tax=Miscanthus lutarioriparius TaxID=422564 RepID=A0A811R3Z1_9POAL|nr:unnamed protein product [Miscanthus lutarioriparius]
MSSTAADVLPELPPIRTTTAPAAAPEPACSSAASSSTAPAPDAESVALPAAEKQQQQQQGRTPARRPRAGAHDADVGGEQATAAGRVPAGAEEAGVGASAAVVYAREAQVPVVRGAVVAPRLLPRRARPHLRVPGPAAQEADPGGLTAGRGPDPRRRGSGGRQLGSKLPGVRWSPRLR